MEPSATNDVNEMLSQEEVLAIGSAVARGLGEFTEEEWTEVTERAIRWVRRLRINECLLDLTLEGRLGMRIEADGEPRFFGVGGPES